MMIWIASGCPASANPPVPYVVIAAASAQYRRIWLVISGAEKRQVLENAAGLPVEALVRALAARLMCSGVQPRRLLSAIPDSRYLSLSGAVTIPLPSTGFTTNLRIRKDDGNLTDRYPLFPPNEKHWPASALPARH
jgi:hypothetical protein